MKTTAPFLEAGWVGGLGMNSRPDSDSDSSTCCSRHRGQPARSCSRSCCNPPANPISRKAAPTLLNRDDVPDVTDAFRFKFTFHRTPRSPFASFPGVQRKLEIKTIERDSLQESFGLNLIEWGESNKRHVVSKVVSGGLADHSGVQQDDHIAMVNGTDVDGMAQHDVLTLLRTSLSVTLGVAGPAVTTVVLTRTTPKESLGFGLLEHVGASNVHRVSRVLPSSLAAGKVFPGDRLVSVNGIDIKSTDHKSVLQLISRSGRNATLGITRVSPPPESQEQRQPEVAGVRETLIPPTTGLSSAAGTVTISRPHPDVEFGMRLAASRGSLRSGYVVTDVAPHGPAGQAGLRVGHRVTTINRTSLDGLEIDALKALLAANVKRATTITFGVQPDALMLTSVLADKVQTVPARAVVPASINDAKRTTTLFRGPTGTFGVVFCGTSGSAASRSALDSAGPAFTGGVFVSRVIPGTSAAQNSDVRPGSRVLAINSIPVKMSNIDTVSMVLNTVKDQLALELGPVSRLWPVYVDSGHDMLGGLDWLKFTLKKKARDQTFGIIFGGPISDEDVKEGIRGIFVCGAQPTTAAQKALTSLPTRLQVGTVNGMNVDNFTLIELGPVLAGCTGNKLTLTVRENTRLFELYTVNETRTVVINRREGGSFGLLLAGAKDDAEAAVRGTGVVVTDVKPAGAAATAGELLVGWQLLSCNGTDVVNETIGAIASVMRTVSDTLTLQLKPNSELAKAYDVRMPEYPWIGDQVVIELERGKAGGFGLTFFGATNQEEADAHGHGVMVVGTRPNSAAANHGGIPIGWQVGRLCGVNVTGSIFATVMAIMSNLASTRMTMVMVPNPKLFAAYQALRPGLAATGGNYELGEPVTVTVPKGPHGFGITFGGAADPAEAEVFGMPGVYVNECTPGGAAARHGGLQSGWQVTEMNGINLKTATLADLTRSMGADSATNMKITYRLNPMLLERYDALHLLPSGDTDAGPNVEIAMGPPVKVVLEKGPTGFGIKFGGASDLDEAAHFGMPGIFINRLTPGGVAEAQGHLQPGWQVTNVNGSDIESGTLVELKACLLAATGQNSITIWHRLNPRLLEVYDRDDLLPDNDNVRGDLPAGNGFAGHIEEGGAVHSTAAANLSAMAGAFSPTGAQSRTVTLQRGPDGFGLVFDGAKNEMEAQDHGYGLFLKSAKVDSVAASNPDVVPGWQLMAINGMDVSDATFVELKSAMLSVGDDITVELEENPNLEATYRAVRAGKLAPPPIVTTSLTKDANGFGLMFGGASTEDEGDELGFGVFITGTKPGSVADSDPSIQPDMQVLTLNGADLRYGIIPDLKALVQTAGNTLHLELQENQGLAQIYAAVSGVELDATSMPVVGALDALDSLDASMDVYKDSDVDDAGEHVETRNHTAVHHRVSADLTLSAMQSAIRDATAQLDDSDVIITTIRPPSTDAPSTDLSFYSEKPLYMANRDVFSETAIEGGLVEITVTNDGSGFGLAFGGANNVEDAASQGKPVGVFLSGVKDGASGAVAAKPYVGWQIVSVGATDLEHDSMAELRDALRDSLQNSNALDLQLKYNPSLQAAHTPTRLPSVPPAGSAMCEVFLVKGAAGFGVGFVGPENEAEGNDLGFGVLVSSADPNSPAAQNPTLVAAIGWQALTLNGIDLRAATRAELKNALKLADGTISLRLQKHRDLALKYGIGSDDAAGRDPRSTLDGTADEATSFLLDMTGTRDLNQDVTATGDKFTVVLVKDERGYGMTFGGAKTVQEGEDKGYGIFITGTKPSSVAAGHAEIVPGLQVMSMNGDDLSDATFSDLKEALRRSPDKLTIEFGPNPELLEAYQGAGAPRVTKDYSVGGVERSAFAPNPAFQQLSIVGESTESLTVTLPHDAKGYGIEFGGAQNAEEATATGGGVFISGVTPGTVAGNNATMAAAVGWQITRLQGVDLADPSVSRVEIRTILEQPHSSITLQMEDNQVLRDAYFFVGESVAATVKAKLTRDARGFGIQFGGAQSPVDAKRRTPGVFISKVHPGSVASRSKALLIAVGWQIVSFNGVALDHGSLEDLKVLLQACGAVMDLELKDNVALRAAYGR